MYKYGDRAWQGIAQTYSLSPFIAAVVHGNPGQSLPEVVGLAILTHICVLHAEYVALGSIIS